MVARRSISTYVAAVDAVSRIVRAILGLLFFAMLALVMGQIVSRMFSISMPWTEELSRLVFIYLIYFGAAVAFHERSMITIDTLPELVPAASKWLPPVVAIIVVLVVGFMFYASISMIRSSWNTSLSTVAWISNAWAYVAFAVSFGLMLIHSTAHLAGWYLARREAP